jgi:hypothetical protein
MEFMVKDQYGRVVFIGNVDECDDYMMNIYRNKGRDAYYKLSIV